MLSGSDIQDYVETRLGREVDQKKILTAINEAAIEIGDLGLLYDTISVKVDDISQWYNLPNDYTFVEQVIFKRGSTDYLYHDYTWRTGSISFGDEGEFTIVARKLPEKIDLLGEPITELHPLYHNAIKFYVLGWIKENNDYSSQEAEKLYQKFEERVIRARNTLIRSKSPSTWQVIRRG